jgi:RNA polymerase sigma-70 factor, ECF subfamily
MQVKQSNSQSSKEKEGCMIAQLYTKYQEYVTRVCFRYVKNQEDAEDLTQEIFLKLIDRLDSFQGDSQISTWLYRIAANHCLDYLRWKKRQAQLRDESGCEWNEASEDPQQYRAEMRLVEKVMEQTSPADRQLFFMHFEAGLTHAEIAEIEGVSRVAITKRLSKAQEQVQNLRMGFEEHYFALPQVA